jgi:molecular chaperone DnaJ
LLNIPEKSSTEDIGKAYRKAALKCHPDVTHDESTEGQFKELTEAYEILKDTAKREHYDKSIMPAAKTAARVRRVTDIQIFLKITVDDISQERTKNISTTRKAPCQSCSGTGSTTRRMVPCQKCGGSGIDIVSSVMGPKKFCQECKGFGNRPENAGCRKCGGSGIMPEKIVREIKIRRDFSPTVTVTASGNYPAECGPGGIYGNLIVSLGVENGKKFEVDGKDIKGSHSVSPAQAILGDAVLLDVFGYVVRLDIPPGTKPNQILSKEKAMTVNNKEKTLRVKILIDIPSPDELSDEETELYKKLLTLRRGVQ